MRWPIDKVKLFELGTTRIVEFCALNSLDTPAVDLVSSDDWSFSVCAYYRPELGIKICLERCQTPCGVAGSRNWTWPASTTDREPYGVLAHELGHHMDWTASEKKGAYYGDYSIALRERSGEKPLTSYCANDAEWFAEIARLFITNPALLKLVRPKTFELLLERWKPLSGGDWVETLGENVPERVVSALRNKMS